MKQHIYSIVFSIFFLSPNLEGHAQSITLLFDDESFIIVASKSNDVIIPIEQCRHHSDPVYQLLYDYYFPASLEVYKSLFYKEKYPVGIENHYELWRTNMEGVHIMVTGQFSGLYRDNTTRILNYTYEKNGSTLRFSFFAKQIEGKWYPYEATEYMQMYTLQSFFPIVNPEVIAGLIQPGGSTPAAKVAQEILTGCCSANRQISAACLYARAEKWAIEGNPGNASKEELLFLRRIEQPGSRATVNATVGIMENFPMDQISLEEAKIINYYLQKGETMIAYRRLQMHIPELTFEEINDKLKQIPGVQGIETKKFELK